MKENKYDDTVFFEKYSQMERSQGGLAAAGEWETLKTLLPDFAGARVLDLGCGYGWHCIYAMQQGAASAVGVDISHRMLEVAREKTSFAAVEYRCVPMEEIDFAPNSFDVALSSLALHYTPAYSEVLRRVYKALRPGGQFVFSAEHPVFTAQGPQDWYRAPDGTPLHFPVDDYYKEGARTACFLGEPVTKYHRTLTGYLDGLLTTGFRIDRVVEPQPPAHLLDSVPGMRDELRRPMMLIVAATKPNSTAQATE